MKAVILAGGFGTDLEPLTEFCPKPMLPVFNKPLIEHTIGFLKSKDISQIVICSNGYWNQLVDYFGNGERWGVDIYWIRETHPKGTAGCILMARDILENDPFLVFDSSIFPRFDLCSLLEFHQKKGTLATIGVHRTRNHVADFESVCVHSDQRLSSITRIHFSRDRRSPFCSAGIYVFEPEILYLISTDGYFDIKEQLLPSLIQAGYPPYVYELRGHCQNIRSVLDYWKINYEIIRFYPQVNHSGQKLEEDVWLGENPNISSTTTLIGPIIIGDNCMVDDDCQIIGPTVVGNNCHISKGSRIRESVIWDNSFIPQYSTIQRSIFLGCNIVSLNGDADFIEPNHISLKEIRLPYQINTSHEYSFNHFQALLRRLFDIVFSLLGLLLSLPLMIMIAVAIKIDSPGPIFFCQTRCGKNGKEFQMIKFRSMVTDAECLKQKLKEKNESDGPMFKMESDPRVTRVGEIIRPLCIDEFPQLFNVLKGDMTLVGPRPLAMEEMRFNPAWRDVRLKVKPGITGLWQITKGKRHSFYNWIEADITYVKNQSIFLDIKILVKTVLSFFGGIFKCWSIPKLFIRSFRDKAKKTTSLVLSNNKKN